MCIRQKPYHKVRVLEHAVEFLSLALVIMQVVVVGGSILDFTAKVRSPQVEVSPCARRSSSHACHMLVMCPQSEGTNLGSLMQSFGGVARNVAGKPTQSHFILTLLPPHTLVLS